MISATRSPVSIAGSGSDIIGDVTAEIEPELAAISSLCDQVVGICWPLVLTVSGRMPDSISAAIACSEMIQKTP